MASQKFPHTFPMVGKTNEQGDLYMLVTTKALVLSNYKGSGEHKQTS